MNPPSGPVVESDAVARLGFRPDQIIQEFGYDDDVAGDFREAVEEAAGGPMEDEDYTGAADAVVLWWRDGDGDLGDALADLTGLLEDEGFVVLLTPARGESGEVEAALVDEASDAAGLHGAGALLVGEGWRAHRLMARKDRARR